MVSPEPKVVVKKTLDCTIRIIPSGSLKRYFQPEQIVSNCKHCPRYGLNWSCPPHDFNVPDYIARFDLAYAIGIKVPLSGFSTEAEAMDYYHRCRRVTNQQLLLYERELSGAVVLIAGHCDLCHTCSKTISLACNYPEQRRRSFESLGFNVSGIVAEFFEYRLQWVKGQTPDSLYIVSGILSHSTCDVDKLKQIFSVQYDGNKK